MILPIKLLAMVALCAAIFVAGHHQAEIEQQAAHAEALELAQKREHELVLTVNDIATRLQKVKEDAENRKNTLLYGLRTGTVRMSIPTASCDRQSSATAARGEQEARAELDGQVAQDLVSIAADGDNAINQLNACIDAYNEIAK